MGYKINHDLVEILNKEADIFFDDSLKERILLENRAKRKAILEEDEFQRLKAFTEHIANILTPEIDGIGRTLYKFRAASLAWHYIRNLKYYQ